MHPLKRFAGTSAADWVCATCISSRGLLVHLLKCELCSKLLLPEKGFWRQGARLWVSSEGLLHMLQPRVLHVTKLSHHLFKMPPNMYLLKKFPQEEMPAKGVEGKSKYAILYQLWWVTFALSGLLWGSLYG